MEQLDCHERWVFPRKDGLAPFVVPCLCIKLWKVYFKKQMVRKTTWSMLLLLLVSMQAFASACDVRCGAMALMGSAGPMVGMAHCQGMASRPLPGHEAVDTAAPSQPCTSHICKNDLAVQSRALHEFGLSTLPVTVLGAATIPIPIAGSLRWKANRSTHSIQTFDPLISSLRV
ncbi:MAG: hypothetical protein ACYDBH_01295 [Acidobacteriaceae bacterium]